jgi:hypothetical protein
MKNIENSGPKKGSNPHVAHFHLPIMLKDNT